MGKILTLALVLCLPVAAEAQVTYRAPQGPPRWVTVEFERTAAQMAVLFTTPYEITPAAPGTVRIPRLLMVYRAAGDAYTVPGTSDLRLQSATAAVWAQVETTGLLDQAAAKTYTQLAPASAAGTLYSTIGLGGGGGAASHDGFFLAITTANITPGAASPTVKFRLYFEEYRLAW